MQIRFPLWVRALLLVLIGAATWLVGILPADGDLSDVTFVQWLGLVIFLGALFGIGVTPQTDPAVVARVYGDQVRAGEAARYETGSEVSKGLTLRQLVDPHATRVNVDPTQAPPVD